MPTDIVVERINVEGPKLLRSYIDFAIDGPSVINGKINTSGILTHDSLFEESVFNFLASRGYLLETQVGCSGYRIDMAVKHPTLSGRFVLGIECDGAMYHSSRTARERDRLRQAVLEDIGWKIYRIWSTDWIKDSITEGKKLIEAIELAISNYSEEISSQNSINIGKTFIEKSAPQTKLPIQYLVVEDKEENDSQYGFTPYTPTNFDTLARRNGNFEACDYIRLLLVNDFPIHYELLCQKLAFLYGRQKVTSIVRLSVNATLARMKSEIELRNNFLFPIPMKKIVIKIPNERKIDFISTEELAEAMYIISNKFIGITKASLIHEVSRIYGFNRTGEKINIAMEKAFDLLLREKRITEIEGKVVNNMSTG